MKKVSHKPTRIAMNNAKPTNKGKLELKSGYKPMICPVPPTSASNGKPLVK